MKLLKRFFRRRIVRRPIAWTLELKCADGLSEYLSYDTKEEANDAAIEQMRLDDFIIGYEITPFYMPNM